ncbi:jmjC domain-containing protein 8 [Festucalex cinctus]
MEILTDLHQTSFRLALLSFFVLLEAQTLTDHQQGGGDGGWSCGSQLSVEDEGPCNVEVVDGSSLSLRHFLNSYAYSTPVVITGLTDNAKFRSLCSKRNLLATYGDRKVRLSTANTYSYTKGQPLGRPSSCHHAYGRWFLYPPSEEPHFHPNMSTLSWLRDVYPRLPSRQTPLQNVLYFPDRWWHATLNLDTSVFISTFLG